MHYYQFNVGDYSSHTSRLSLLEDLAYRRLLDLYYLQERPVTGSAEDVARDIGLQSEQTEVDYVLNKYFTQDGEKWINDRCEREILAYQNKRELASIAGKASAEARRVRDSKQMLNERLTDVQPNNKHKTVTNKHKTNTGRRTKFTDDDLKLAHEMSSLVNGLELGDKPPDFEKWADTIRLIREQDGRDIKSIESVFQWANNNEFWQSNIRSPAKLREKWPTLIGQMKRDQNAKSNEEWVAMGDRLGIEAARGESMPAFIARVRSYYENGQSQCDM